MVKVCDRHLAVAAVEAEDEFLSVVKQEQRTAFLASMMFRAHAELISHAIFSPHEFCVLYMS